MTPACGVNTLLFGYCQYGDKNACFKDWCCASVNRGQRELVKVFSLVLQRQSFERIVFICFVNKHPVYEPSPSRFCLLCSESLLNHRVNC